MTYKQHIRRLKMYPILKLIWIFGGINETDGYNHLNKYINVMNKIKRIGHLTYVLKKGSLLELINKDIGVLQLLYFSRFFRKTPCLTSNNSLEIICNNCKNTCFPCENITDYFQTDLFYTEKFKCDKTNKIFYKKISIYTFKKTINNHNIEYWKLETISYETQ